MPRGTTAEERREAVTILPGGEYNPEDDVADAFDQWREATNESQIPGKISAWQIPMDDHGIPQPSAKNQIRLGAWPIDAYKFDDLCGLIIRDFMTPEKVICVRFIGSKAGEGGVRFTRIVILRASNKEEQKANGAQSENLSALLRTIQESNERTLALLQRVQQPQKPDVEPMAEMQKMMVFAKMMNEPTTELLKILLPVLAGRAPPAATDPMAGLSGLIDVAGKLADLRGGGESGEGGGPEWLQALKAVVPLAKPALEAIASQRPVAVMPPQRAAISAPPGMGPQQPAPVPQGPTAATPTQPMPAPQPSMSMGDIPSGDIQVFAQLKPQVDALLQIAKDGGDPVGAADLMFDEMILSLPDEFYDKLGDMFARDNLVHQLAVFHPAVLQHREFFEKFKKQVDARFTKEDSEAGERPTDLSANG